MSCKLELPPCKDLAGKAKKQKKNNSHGGLAFKNHSPKSEEKLSNLLVLKQSDNSTKKATILAVPGKKTKRDSVGINRCLIPAHPIWLHSAYAYSLVLTNMVPTDTEIAGKEQRTRARSREMKSGGSSRAIKRNREIYSSNKS